MTDKQLSLPAIPAALRPRPSKARGYKRRQPEFEQQCHLFRFLRLYANKEPRFGFIFSIPNGLYTLPKTKGDAVASGLREGVWDIFCPFPRQPTPDDSRIALGMFIEMKWGRNDLTEEQEEFQKAMLAAGYSCGVCYSWLDAARFICSYLRVSDPDILEAIR